MNNTFYLIDKQERDNWLALFEELQQNGIDGPAVLYAWWVGEQFLIEQSIMELTTLDEYDGEESEDSVLIATCCNSSCKWEGHIDDCITFKHDSKLLCPICNEVIEIL